MLLSYLFSPCVWDHISIFCLMARVLWNYKHAWHLLFSFTFRWVLFLWIQMTSDSLTAHRIFCLPPDLTEHFPRHWEPPILSKPQSTVRIEPSRLCTQWKSNVQAVEQKNELKVDQRLLLCYMTFTVSWTNSQGWSKITLKLKICTILWSVHFKLWLWTLKVSQIWTVPRYVWQTLIRNICSAGNQPPGEAAGTKLSGHEGLVQISTHRSKPLQREWKM